MAAASINRGRRSTSTRLTSHRPVPADTSSRAHIASALRKPSAAQTVRTAELVRVKRCSMRSRQALRCGNLPLEFRRVELETLAATLAQDLLRQLHGPQCASRVLARNLAKGCVG